MGGWACGRVVGLCGLWAEWTAVRHRHSLCDCRPQGHRAPGALLLPATMGALRLRFTRSRVPLHTAALDPLAMPTLLMGATKATSASNSLPGEPLAPPPRLHSAPPDGVHLTARLGGLCRVACPSASAPGYRPASPPDMHAPAAQVLEYTFSSAAIARGFTSYFATLVGTSPDSLRFDLGFIELDPLALVVVGAISYLLARSGRTPWPVADARCTFCLGLGALSPVLGRRHLHSVLESTHTADKQGGGACGGAMYTEQRSVTVCLMLRGARRQPVNDAHTGTCRLCCHDIHGRVSAGPWEPALFPPGDPYLRRHPARTIPSISVLVGQSTCHVSEPTDACCVSPSSLYNHPPPPPAHRGTKDSKNFNWAVTTINLACIAFVLLAGFPSSDPSNWKDFAPFGVRGMFAGAGGGGGGLWQTVLGTVLHCSVATMSCGKGVCAQLHGCRPARGPKSGGWWGGWLCAPDGPPQ